MHCECRKECCFAAKLKRLFEVSFLTVLNCTKDTCTWQSHPPPESGTDVSMMIKPGKLQELLKDFEAPEDLNAGDDYRCQRCRGMVQKMLHVHPLGQALLLHLKRFEYKQGRGYKLNHYVSFPRMLQVGSARFEFTAMVAHIGKTINSGHYVAYVQSSKIWCCDDTSVVEVPWHEVENQEAYLLAYVRVDK